ncbi:unnamed protein product [Thlaspi arvense]|uniref:EF-hand domain-containing protein n=1 Tax=Thlaspi arvense TaxID=13288 RepID=A0AAU9SQN1_THLAR|nr:unnamed protein product [Thlaspi arvense]
MSGSEESESEEEVRYPSDEPKEKMSEYEKQRLSRIAENEARLEALGIPKAAKALVGSRKRREKPNPGEEDDDYRPGEETDGNDYDDEDEEFLGNSSSVSRKRMTSAPKRKNLNRSDPLGEDEEGDDDLNKAIALSLQDSEAVAGGSATTTSKTRRSDQETPTWKKRKPELMSKMQMTADELVIYFYQIDEAGKGFITLRDVAKMATVHDFTWTDEELQDMIRCFDMDKDGKLSLDEFSKIVTRCRMLKESSIGNL